MSLDKKVWQEALKHYAEWNQAKLIQEIHDAGKKTPQQKWEEYKAFFAFVRQMKPKPSDWELKKRVEEWEEYYRRVIEFEERRRQRGRQT